MNTKNMSSEFLGVMKYRDKPRYLIFSPCGDPTDIQQSISNDLGFY